MTLLLAFLLGLVGCGRPAEPSRPTAATRNPGPSLREEARFVLESHCGECHRPDQPTANPGALAVFDLARPDFGARMTEEQLRDALLRLEQKDAPSADRDVFGAWVDEELARRAEPVRCASNP